MNAIELRSFGAEELRMSCVPDPTPGLHEIKVRVQASSINPLDFQTCRGDYRNHVKLPATLGNDASGVVVDVGAAVHGWRPGDEVFYFAPLFAGPGTHAEYHVVDAALVVRKPARLSHEQAAALPLAASTAYTALHTRAQVRPGETVVVHAGAGGVGSLAVQIAKAAGARVIATCRSAASALVSGLGADLTIDYTRDDWVEAVNGATHGRGADIIFDTIGGDTLSRAALALQPGGRVVTIVDTATPQNLLTAWGRNARYEFLFISPSAAVLGSIAALVNAGRLVPVIDRVLPWCRIVEAYRRVATGSVRGKVVITMAGE
jgi:NADPH:quinone reductase